MSEDMKTRQWPDNITSGPIRYGKANNYDGFYLADDDHGIPTFGSVCDASPPTIRGQHVRVFNYPGQTEAIAAELVKRWNAHDQLVAALKRIAFLRPVGATPKMVKGELIEQIEKIALAALSSAARTKGAEQ